MPLFGKDTTVGLEVSGRALRAVQIEHGQERPRLLALETQQLPESSPDALITEGPVWRLVKAGRKAGRLVVNVPGPIALIRKIEVEVSEIGHLHDWVKWEAQQYLPGPVEDYFVDFQKLKPHDQAGLWHILLVVARREAVRERARLFETVHLAPTIMDLDPLALQNAFEVNYPSVMDNPVALVNLESDLATLMATRGGVPEGVLFLEMVTEVEVLGQQIRSGLDDLLRRMKRHEGGIERFSKVLLSGGGPHLQDVANFLSSADGLEVELADPFRELVILPALREELDRTYRPAEFMLATGLALRKA